MDDVLWPLRGVLLFLRSPRWWVRPIIGMALTMAAFAGLGVGVAWWLWPDGQSVTGVWWWMYAGISIGLAACSTVVAWVLLLPIVLSFLLEDLARKANAYAKEKGIPSLGPAESLAGVVTGIDRAASHELATVPGLLASLKVLGGTLPLRFGWMATSFISGLIIPPLGVVISALGMGHIACIDAVDISLSLRGYNGHQRLAALKAHRNEIRQAALTASLLHLGLSVTIVGWLLWLPGIVVGAALRTRSWSDARSGELPPSAPVPAPAAGGGVGA